MVLQESGEMYIETIHVLSKKMGNSVRAIDVGRELGYSKPSVSRAISILKNGGFVNVDEGGYISLTEVGHEFATKIYERHLVMSEFLMAIGVEKEIAVADACKMEHVISDEAFEALKYHLEKIKAL